MQEAIAKKTGDKEYTTLFVRDDTIIKKVSTHHTGTNRHSGKTYSRFEEKSSLIFSWKRNNRMRVYQSSAHRLDFDRSGRRRKARTFHDATTQVLRQPDYWTRDVDEAFKMRFGKSAEKAFQDEYPMLAYAEPVRHLTQHLVAKDAADLTLRLYGNPRFRKDLVRAVGGVLEYAPNETTSDALLAGKVFAGLAPTDWLVSWIPRAAREIKASQFVAEGLLLPEARRMFRTASEKQIRRLLTTDGSMYFFRDTQTMFAYLRGIDPDFALRDLSFGSFRELHDVLAREQRKAKNPKIDIEYTGPAAELPGEYGEYRIVAPTDSWAVDEWGDLMSNCISGYSRRAASQDTLLYGVYRGSELVANMELKPNGDVKQLLGKFNRGLDAEVQDVVYDAILDVWPYANTAGGWQGTVHNPRRQVQDPNRITFDEEGWRRIQNELRRPEVEGQFFDGIVNNPGDVLAYQWQGAPAQGARVGAF